jgi:hypothetical protein
MVGDRNSLKTGLIIAVNIYAETDVLF